MLWGHNDREGVANPNLLRPVGGRDNPALNPVFLLRHRSENRRTSCALQVLEEWKVVGRGSSGSRSRQACNGGFAERVGHPDQPPSTIVAELRDDAVLLGVGHLAPVRVVSGQGFRAVSIQHLDLTIQGVVHVRRDAARLLVRFVCQWVFGEVSDNGRTPNSPKLA